MSELELLAREAATKYGLDPRLICALCEVESGWNPRAVRHEAGYRWLWGAQHQELFDETPTREFMEMKSRLGIELKTEKFCQQTSWGLLQIMGAVARERGFRGWLTELCDPTVNLEWGCKHLRWMLDHPLDYGLSIAQGPAVLKGTLADLAAAWNGGTRVVVDGKYKNQPYVDRVVRAMEGY